MTNENTMTAVENRIAAQQQEAMQGELIERQDSYDLFQNFGDSTMRESHSFGIDGRKAWSQIALASAPDVKIGSDHIDKTIAMADYYCHEVEISDMRTGKVNRAIRTVIYEVSGDRYAFVSVGVARDMLRITKIFGKGPWKDAILVKPAKVKTRSGFHIIRLMPA